MATMRGAGPAKLRSAPGGDETLETLVVFALDVVKRNCDVPAVVVSADAAVCVAEQVEGPIRQTHAGEEPIAAVWGPAGPGETHQKTGL